MKTLTLVQGSPEWHAHRANHWNASDSPAMMGVSPYKTRNAFLRQKATGLTEEFDSETKRRFYEGHRAEALARPLAEKIIGEDLYPVTGTEGEFSASFDGLTMDESKVWEHKALNDDIRASATAAELPAHYRVQMEQQLMISGAKSVLFSATKWDEDGQLLEEKHLWYSPDLELRKQIVAGWAQFAEDLKNYVPQDVAEPPPPKVVTALPALFVHAKGEITADNMDAFGAALTARLQEVRSIVLATDQDFSDAKEAAKKFRETAKDIALSKEQMLAQTETIGEAARKMDAWAKDLNATALQLEKDVAREDAAKKAAMVAESKAAFSDYVEALETEIGALVKLDIQQPDWAGAIKGKSKYASMQNALDTLLANSKIIASGMAKDMRAKLTWYNAHAEGYAFLFSDLRQIIVKPMDDFQLVVTSRINGHKAEEDKRLEAEREKIRAEEAAKAQREAEAKARAEAEEKAKIEAQQRATETAPPTTNPEPSKEGAGVASTTLPIVTGEASVSPAPATVRTFSAPRKTRPTDDEIIGALSLHFRVHESKVIEWLLEMDVPGAGARLLRDEMGAQA